MIYVTIGTTQFDELIIAIDKIASKIDENIIIQIGKGKYIPKNYQYFRFTKNPKKYYKKANLVIAHGGAGTTFEVLNLQKKLISVANNKVPDSHQGDLLKKLSEENYIIWCKDVSKICDSITQSKKFRFKKYVKPECTIHKIIMRLLG
ncbi:TPA: glycosyltransferase [Candidatus Woesearchaeota archaeon]|nr:glycosyltransferase [Candidatus Woesearchaeota archaeon]